MYNKTSLARDASALALPALSYQRFRSIAVASTTATAASTADFGDVAAATFAATAAMMFGFGDTQADAIAACNSTTGGSFPLFPSLYFTLGVRSRGFVAFRLLASGAGTVWIAE